MNVQTEKSILINLLQSINDVSIIERVKNFVVNEIEPNSLSQKQKIELDKRINEYKDNPNSDVDAFGFLDKLKSKYEL